MAEKKELKDDRISFIGNRDSWQDFVYKIKKNKKKVWQVLGPMLDKYIKSNWGFHNANKFNRIQKNWNRITPK